MISQGHRAAERNAGEEIPPDFYYTTPPPRAAGVTGKHRTGEKIKNLKRQKAVSLKSPGGPNWL